MHLWVTTIKKWHIIFVSMGTELNVMLILKRIFFLLRFLDALFNCQYFSIIAIYINIRTKISRALVVCSVKKKFYNLLYYVCVVKNCLINFVNLEWQCLKNFCQTACLRGLLFFCFNDGKCSELQMDRNVSSGCCVGIKLNYDFVFLYFFLLYRDWIIFT